MIYRLLCFEGGLFGALYNFVFGFRWMFCFGWFEMVGGLFMVFVLSFSGIVGLLVVGLALCLVVSIPVRILVGVLCCVDVVFCLGLDAV